MHDVSIKPSSPTHSVCVLKEAHLVLHFSFANSSKRLVHNPLVLFRRRKCKAHDKNQYMWLTIFVVAGILDICCSLPRYRWIHVCGVLQYTHTSVGPSHEAVQCVQGGGADCHTTLPQYLR